MTGEQEMAEERPKNKSERIVEAYFLASIGLEMGVAVFIGWAFGRWLDQKFDTDPWLMLIFLLVGVAAGFKPVIKLALKANAQAKSQSEASNPPKARQEAGQAARQAAGQHKAGQEAGTFPSIEDSLAKRPIEQVSS